eukprot:9331-Chlamydomonas_euryale.AAC.2
MDRLDSVDVAGRQFTSQLQIVSSPCARNAALTLSLVLDQRRVASGASVSDHRAGSLRSTGD